jgi:hypothetical protein
MSRVNYRKLTPPSTFISDYLLYCDASETPYAYDFWTACWLLSVALGRDISVDRPYAPVHLNLYCILVAESGTTRKSTSVRRATGFARGVIGDDTLLIESKTTPEKLEYDLALQTLEHGNAYAAIAIDELVKFLGTERYVQAMPTLLTDLYDAPSIRTGGGSLVRGSVTLRNVYVNFLSASTPSWLLRAVNPDVIEGGFTSRVIFIVCDEPKRSSPWPEPVDEQLKTSIRTSLEHIREKASRVGQIRLTTVARQRFERWYRSRDKKRDPFRASFQSREDAHVLRLAALLSVNDGTWEIQANHISAAIKCITEVREDGASIFEGTGTNSRIIVGVDALRDKLIAAGANGVKQSELTKALQRHMNAEHVLTGLNIMHDLQMVQRFDNIKLGRGRPTTLWRATQGLLAPKALDSIIERVGM